MEWFRLYDEIATDPDVVVYPEPIRWRLVALFCLANRQTIRGEIPLSDEKIRKFFGISPKKYEKTLEIFFQEGFIEPLGDGREGYRITNWNKRQFKSDNSSERVRKHREMKRYSNGDVTSPEQIQNRTDTERDKDTCPEQISFPLKTGENYTLPAELHETYQQAYSNLDFLQEYKKMQAWLQSNPGRRKTERGMPKFINSWLSRVKDGTQDDWRQGLRDD